MDLTIDGYARDVTLRYTKTYGAKTVKLRVPQKKDEPDWWAQVVGFLQRPLRLVCSMGNEADERALIPEPRRARGRRARNESIFGRNAPASEWLQGSPIVG